MTTSEAILGAMQDGLETPEAIAMAIGSKPATVARVMGMLRARGRLPGADGAAAAADEASESSDEASGDAPDGEPVDAPQLLFSVWSDRTVVLLRGEQRMELSAEEVDAFAGFLGHVRGVLVDA